MAIAFRAASVGDTGGVSASTISIPTPSGVVAGDVMVCAIASLIGSSVSSPDWTQIRAQAPSGTTGEHSDLTTFYRVATASEPTDHVFNLSLGRPAAGGISAYSGVDTASPIDVSAGANDAGVLGTTLTAPTLTTNFANDWVLRVYCAGSINTSTTTVTPPAGTSERFERAVVTTATNRTVESADASQAAAGAAGTAQATASQTSGWCAQTIALAALPPGPAFRSASSSGTPTVGASSITVSAPAGVLEGDLMVAALQVSGGTGATVTPPAGWALVAPVAYSSTVLGLHAYQKVAESSEPVDYTWTFDASRYACGAIAAYYQTSSDAPVDATGSQANASSATITAPTVTTHSPEERLVFAGAIDSSSTFTPPTGMTERLEVTGYSLGVAGGAKTFYLLDSLSGATQFYASQEDGSAPADAAHSTATGWIAATNAAGQSALLDSLTEISRTSADWSATLQPSAAPASARGDAWSTPTPMRGQFASGNWTLSMSVRSVTAAYTGRFRLRWRVWASVNQNGSSARELTGATQVTATTTANLSTSANTTLSVTWSPGAAIVLDGEYVFFQLGIEIITAGSGTTTDVNLRKNSAAAITTPAWTPGLAGSLMLADEYRITEGATGTRAGTASLAAVNAGQALSLNPPAVTAPTLRVPRALMLY